MAQHPNPVLLYHPDGYRVARQDLKGRHSAGEAFLTAFLEQAKDADIYGLCLEKGGAEHFAETIKAFGRGLKPNPVSAQIACSLDEPQPKLLPDRRIWAPLASGLFRTKSGLGEPSEV